MDPLDRAPQQETARRPRWVRVAVAGFLAFELAAGAALVARDRDLSPEPGAAASPTATRTPPRQDSADRSATLRAAAVGALLERRATAIRRHDRALFASTLDRGHPAFVTKQLAVFAALADVPLADWRYDVDADDTATPPSGYGADAWAPRVTLRYRLSGFDDEPTAAEQFFTFVRRGDAWLIAGDADYDASGRRTARDLWDFGPVAVVRGTHSLVLGHVGYRSLLRDIARQTDDAVPRVTGVWGRGWTQRVVVVVPETQQELAAILGDDTDLARIAAVAVAELPGDTGDKPVGNRVLVNPPNFRRLGANGRRVVLTHEVTHVATRDASSDRMPTWLVEGFADYVGYLRTGLSARAICQELAAEVRHGRVPVALPNDKDFDGGNARLAQAYESAWLAVRLIAERHGTAGLVAFYRKAGESRDVDVAIGEVLHTTPESFTRAWRAYTKKTLG